MRLTTVICWVLAAILFCNCAQSAGVIPELRVGVDVYKNVTIEKRLETKLLISHSAGMCSIEIANMDEKNRALCGISGLVMPSPTERVTALILTNVGGSDVAGGYSLFLNTSNSICRPSSQGSRAGLQFETAVGTVALAFGGPKRTYVHPGVYENAVSRGQGPFPDFEISAFSRGNDGKGRFEVMDATFVNDRLATFHGTFSYTADNAFGSVTGEVFYNTKAFLPKEILGRSSEPAPAGPRYTALIINPGLHTRGGKKTYWLEAMVKASKESNGGYRFTFVKDDQQEISFRPPPNESLHVGLFKGAKSSNVNTMIPMLRIVQGSMVDTDVTYDFEIKYLEVNNMGDPVAFHAHFSRTDGDGYEGEVCYNSPFKFSLKAP